MIRILKGEGGWNSVSQRKRGPRGRLQLGPVQGLVDPSAESGFYSNCIGSH